MHSGWLFYWEVSVGAENRILITFSVTRSPVINAAIKSLLNDARIGFAIGGERLLSHIPYWGMIRFMERENDEESVRGISKDVWRPQVNEWLNLPTTFS